MSAGDTKRKIAGKSAAEYAETRLGRSPVGLGSFLARNAAAQIYAVGKAAYRLMEGRKAFVLYGSGKGGLQSFDALREKIDNDPSDARVQLSGDQLSAIVSFKNDNSRYECPQDRMSTQFYRQLQNRTMSIVSKRGFGRNPIYRLRSGELQQNINIEQQEQTTEDRRNITAAESAANRVQQMPESLRKRLEIETRILPAPLRNAYVDNVQNVIDAGGKNGENFVKFLPGNLHERMKIIKNVSQLPQEDRAKWLGEFHLATTERRYEMYNELGNVPSQDHSAAGSGMTQTDPVVRPIRSRSTSPQQNTSRPPSVREGR